MKKEIKYKSLSATNFGKISVLCPSCETVGTFDELSGTDYSLGGEFIGIRICPKKGCKSIVFLWLDNTQNIIAKFPQTSIKFESNNVPENIKTTLIEAIECHGNQCFRAAAVMTRRTLEEICDDRSAKGNDLFQRIEDLKKKIVISPALLEGMHEIRYLGSDGAHIELKWFDGVGEEEVGGGY